MTIYNRDSFGIYMSLNSPIYQQGHYQDIRHSMNPMWFYLLCNEVLGYNPYPFTAQVSYCVLRLLDMEKRVIECLDMKVPNHISHLLVFPGSRKDLSQFEIHEALYNQTSMLMSLLNIPDYYNHIDYNAYFQYYCHVHEIISILKDHPHILTQPA